MWGGDQCQKGFESSLGSEVLLGENIRFSKEWGFTEILCFVGNWVIRMRMRLAVGPGGVG